MAYDTVDNASIMSKANEENGSESGDNDDIEEDNNKDDSNVINNTIKESQNGANKDIISNDNNSETNSNTNGDVIDNKHEPSAEQSNVDCERAQSPMSADKMPHRMEKSQSPKEHVKTGSKRERDSPKSSSSRPETPPLKRLMRQDPLPLFVHKRQHSPPKKHLKESFYPHKFHIPPMTLSAMSVIKNAPTHPKQTMSKSKMYSNKLPKTFHPVYPVSSTTFSSSCTPPTSSSHPSSSSSSSSSMLSRSISEDQPLDLSKKTGSKQSHYRNESEHSPSNSKAANGHMSSLSGVPSTLQSLQQRFGGNLHMRSLRKPLCGLLPVMPDVLPKSRSPLHHNSHSSSSLHHFSKKPHHRPSGNTSPHHHSPAKSDKVDNSPSRTNPDKDSQEDSSRCDTDLNSNLTIKNETVDETDNEDNKYTMHRCTCQKSYNSLYALSLHLQETGHLPAGGKQSNLMEYPKLVRGQDMWLNQESEHTKRILRCMQCGESFKSLPMLTVHMMQTQHYTKIVSSEHGRRSHKCSAYCDRETDRECIFKCKVCNSTFTDMEGLANHMILSGHHKKNILRSHNYLSEFAFRGRRKRMFSGEDALDSVGSMSSLLDYKRKCLTLSTPPPVNGHSRYTDSPDSESAEDSTISCENCGERIETINFVEHVRLCLRSRPSELDKVKLSLYKDEVASVKSEKSHGSHGDLEELDDENVSMFENPLDSEEDVEVKAEVKEEDFTSGSEDMKENKILPKSDDNIESDDEDLDSANEKDKKTNDKSETSNTKPEKEEERDKQGGSMEKQKEDILKRISPKTFDTSKSDKCREEEDDKDSVEEGEITPYLKLSKALKTEDKKYKRQSIQDSDESDRIAFRKVAKSHDTVKKLDIIDPERTTEGDSGNSALQAMESFIQKSFSSKFNYRRGNMVFNSGERSLLKPTLQQIDRKESRHNSLYRFEKYRKYFQQDEQHNGSMKKPLSEAAESLKMCMPMSASSSSAKDDLKKLEKLCESVKKSNSPIANSDENKSATAFSMERPASGSSENGEILASKYLNYESDGEVENNTNRAGSSALDSLSSFVYGQPLNSEHPLDSLQKLITKTDIPKLLASQSMKYFQRCADSPEVSLPLNLSLKKGCEEESEGMDRDMFSDHEGSESDSDTNVEYRCAACSRHFASKGSYRYHLSRCHLSSVKKYGIKEAFNMSPYVYLPLDHTAKFSKYYEMAHELASKGK